MTALFHCERCGGDRPYRRVGAGRLTRAFGGRVGRSRGIGEHLRCTICGTCYRVELLAVPTTGQMLGALLKGTTAAVLAMLAAGEQIGDAARQRAVEVIRDAGAPDYDRTHLDRALNQAAPGQPGLAEPGLAEPGLAERGLGEPGLGQPASSQAGELRSAIETFAIQLDIPAREWFLASVVQVGLADGSLSDGQRELAGVVARYLGLTQAAARAVIVRTEEAAQAG